MTLGDGCRHRAKSPPGSVNNEVVAASNRCFGVFGQAVGCQSVSQPNDGHINSWLIRKLIGPGREWAVSQ